MISITYNVGGWSGWPRNSLKKLSSIEIGKLFANALKKYKPDIITFSEASPCSIINVIANELDMEVVIFPSSWCWPGVLLTKYKVLESRGFSLDKKYWSRDLFTRHWGRCIIETEFGKIILHSLHLYPDPNSKIHEEENIEFLRFLRNDIKTGLPILVQGDLNHEPFHKIHNTWLKMNLIDTFVKVGLGDGNTYKSDDPKSRIDYIFVYGILTKHLVMCRVLNEVPFKLDKRIKYALSDHLPVMAIFK